MPAIQYRFSVTGQREVIKSYAEIAAQAKAAGDAIRAVGRGGSSGGGGGGARGDHDAHVKERARAEKQAAQERIRAERAVAIEAARAARAAVAAHKAAEREKTNTTRQEAKQREAIERAEGKKLADFYSHQAKTQAREQAKIARDQLREKARIEREKARIAKARGELGGDFGDMVGGAVGKFGIGLGLGAMYGVGRGAMDIGGAAARRRVGLEATATRLSIGGRGAGTAGVNSSELLQEAELTARGVKGATAEDILEAQSRFVSMTGDLGQARKLSRSMAITSLATGARGEDVASTMATLRDKFGISQEKEMQDAIAKLVQGGKSGAFEFKDAGAYFAEMGAAGQRFGLGKGTKGVATLGGLAQIARASTGSGAEASTAVQAMMRQLIAKGADKGKEGIKKLTGFDVFTDKSNTKAKNIEDVLVGVIGGAKGDMGKLQKIFGEEGIRGVSGMITAYNDAALALGKGAKEADRRAAGEKALREMLDKNINVASNWGEVVRDASTAGKTMEASWSSLGQRLMSTIGTSLDPLMKTLTTNFSVFSKPIAEAGKGVSLFAQSLANVVQYLRSEGLLKGDEDEKLTPGDALDKLATNQNELDQINTMETKYGRLSDKQAIRRAELNAENAELVQTAGESDVMALGYKQYLGMVGSGRPAEDYSTWIMSRSPDMKERRAALGMPEGPTSLGGQAGQFIAENKLAFGIGDAMSGGFASGAYRLQAAGGDWTKGQSPELQFRGLGSGSGAGDKLSGAAAEQSSAARALTEAASALQKIQFAATLNPAMLGDGF